MRVKDRRGNYRDRRARKEWMLTYFGDGTHCSCTHCGTKLTYDTIEADRIVPGGSYRRDNIQPSCRRCNAQRKDSVDWQYDPALHAPAVA